MDVQKIRTLDNQQWEAGEQVTVGTGNVLWTIESFWKPDNGYWRARLTGGHGGTTTSVVLSRLKKVTP